VPIGIAHIAVFKNDPFTALLLSADSSNLLTARITRRRGRVNSAQRRGTSERR
jgi:hypothetical protein